MGIITDQSQVYLNWINSCCSGIDADRSFIKYLDCINWDNPETITDFNSIAVIALIEAENCKDAYIKNLYLDTALDALNHSISLEVNIVGLIHYSFLFSITGEREQGTSLAWDGWLRLNILTSDQIENFEIFYFPPDFHNIAGYRSEVIERLLKSSTAQQKYLTLLTEALCLSSLVFYNMTSIRWLRLAADISPESAWLNLKLGIALFTTQQWEGFYYLQRALQLCPKHSLILQSLYLAFRTLGLTQEADFWQKQGWELANKPQWTMLPSESPFTYVNFDQDLTLAVEASFKSLVTSTLVAQGDWFEDEMEFWRDWIQPGMTVIDVGANVGVYTFSAARQVGAMGKVLAIEPFSSCMNCLQESRRINQFNWVILCHGAASDHQGKARLMINSASELNELVMDDKKAVNTESVNCFTLDSLFKQEILEKVDIIKIDAEGHELSVLKGSQRILSDFSPVILYENIAGNHGSNLAVSEYLLSLGYSLFRYHPHYKNLVIINDFFKADTALNIIAMHLHNQDMNFKQESFI